MPLQKLASIVFGIYQYHFDEVLVPDNSDAEFKEISLFSTKKVIPSLGFMMKFMGLELSVGAFINFAIDISDIKVNIPLGLDYFKGYMLIASKYFEITPT